MARDGSLLDGIVFRNVFARFQTDSITQICFSFSFSTGFHDGEFVILFRED